MWVICEASERDKYERVTVILWTKSIKLVRVQYNSLKYVHYWILIGTYCNQLDIALVFHCWKWNRKEILEMTITALNFSLTKSNKINTLVISTFPPIVQYSIYLCPELLSMLYPISIMSKYIWKVGIIHVVFQHFSDCEKG